MSSYNKGTLQPSSFVLIFFSGSQTASTWNPRPCLTQLGKREGQGQGEPSRRVTDRRRPEGVPALRVFLSRKFKYNIPECTHYYQRLQTTQMHGLTALVAGHPERVSLG